MVEMVNYLTKTQMWVADDRVEEYKAAGHVLAAEPGTAPAEVEEVKETKKRTKKKKSEE